MTTETEVTTTTSAPIRKPKQREILILREILITNHPDCFEMDNRKPLKIGIKKDILALYPDMDKDVLNSALCRYCHGASYLNAMQSNTHRIDLNGKEVSEIIPEHSANAANELKEWKEMEESLAAKKKAFVDEFGGNPEPINVQKLISNKLIKALREPRRAKPHDIAPTHQKPAILSLGR